MILNEVLEDFVRMSKMLEEKDQRIKELEQQVYNLINVVGHSYRERIVELDHELALYKKALENEMQKKAEELNQSLGVMGASQLNYEDLIESVLNQAKEEIDENNKKA